MIWAIGIIGALYICGAIATAWGVWTFNRLLGQDVTIREVIIIVFIAVLWPLWHMILGILWQSHESKTLMIINRNKEEMEQRREDWERANREVQKS